MSFLTAPASQPFISAASWSALPLASAATPGEVYRVAGVGAGGFSFWISDGTYWRPQNGRVCLYSPKGDRTAPISTVFLNQGDNLVFPLVTPMLIPAKMLSSGAQIEIFYQGSRDAVGIDYIRAGFSTLATVVSAAPLQEQPIQSLVDNSFQAMGWFAMTDRLGAASMTIAAINRPGVYDGPGFDRNQVVNSTINQYLVLSVEKITGGIGPWEMKLYQAQVFLSA